MTLNDEIILQITKLPDAPEIIDNWEHNADSLSGMFNWVSSKNRLKKRLNICIKNLVRIKNVGLL